MSEEVIGSMKSIFSVLPLLGSVVGIVALIFYKIDEDVIRKNSQELERRRSAENGNKTVE